MGGSMSSVIISGDTSGAITLSAPAVSGTNTATLPAATGTVMVSGNMPAFSVYANPSGNVQAVSNNTWTKLILNIKSFDTANAFDSTTNYRFTPQVAGYYQINASISLYCTSSFPVEQGCAVYVNGSPFYYFADINPSASLTSNNFSLVAGSTTVYLNGSTDYVELYGYVYSSSTCYFAYGGNQGRTSRLSGNLVRSA
jgi:hypothetical protein